MENLKPEPPRDGARECFGKKSYATQDQADRVAAKVWIERETSLRVYTCDFCARFHLTKRAAPERVKPGYHEALRPRHERDREKYGKRRNRG